jgi:hypothetical protein
MVPGSQQRAHQELNVGWVPCLARSWLKSLGDEMTVEQSDLELEMVPIVNRCYRGCGTRAVVSDGVSNFCAKCALTILKAAALRVSGLAA